MWAERLMEVNTLMSQSRVFRPVWPVNNGLVLCPFPATNPLTHTRAFCCFTCCFLLSPLFTSCTRRLTYISLTVCPLISLRPSGKPDLVLLDDVGKLSGPHEAVVRRDEQETVAAVQGGRSGFYQPGLDVPPAWIKDTHKELLWDSIVNHHLTCLLTHHVIKCVN